MASCLKSNCTPKKCEALKPRTILLRHGDDFKRTKHYRAFAFCYFFLVPVPKQGLKFRTHNLQNSIIIPIIMSPSFQTPTYYISNYSLNKQQEPNRLRIWSLELAQNPPKSLKLLSVYYCNSKKLQTLDQKMTVLKDRLGCSRSRSTLL